MDKLKRFEEFNESKDIVSKDPLLFNLVSGALKNTIDDHGTITKRFIPSATKRICGQITGYFEEQLKKKIQSEQTDDFIVISKEKYDEMISNLKRKNKSISDLVAKLKDSGKL
jgi:hypothetical protein